MNTESLDPVRATQLLERLSNGDPAASGELLPLLYSELRTVAAACMARQRSDHTLQPTALVHEAWMRIVGSQGQQRWSNRTHFVRAAAQAMRHVLVDHARAKGAEKRGRGARSEALESVDGSGPARGIDSILAGFAELQIDVLALNEALERLTETDPDLARVVELRFFAGLTVVEIAGLLEVSERTVHRSWRFARVWLQDALGDD